MGTVSYTHLDVYKRQIKGKTDKLVGLKENVIIGKLIPAGTGMQKYDEIVVQSVAEKEDEVAVAEAVGE